MMGFSANALKAVSLRIRHDFWRMKQSSREIASSQKPLLAMIHILFLFLAMTFVATNSFANNLTISKLNVEAIATQAKTITFTFDVSQDNSWRNTINNDAIWIFMKYSTDGGMTWKHASAAGSGRNPTGFSAGANFEIIVPEDERGMFLQRNDFGSGTIDLAKVKFVWDYGQDGLSDATAQAANTINKVFGIEMVYVPQGAFFAGDGNSSSEFRFKQGNADNDPWYINSENAFTTANIATDGFYYQSSGAAGESVSGEAFLVPASFPKGYKSFYLMKYELTEGQWVGFFNTLTPAQKLSRDITHSFQGGKGSDAIINRNTVSWDSSNANLKATTLRPNRPMTYISWPDIAAYADWAGLRPATELEFEKAARGKDIAAVADEFAWGTSSYNAPNSGDIYPGIMDENGVEGILDGTANLNRNSLGWTSGDGRNSGIAEGQKGPLRGGIFAENSSNRITAGAGYYGNMELSGNVSDVFVTIGRSQARGFLGTHGDGELTSRASFEGFATNTDWPGIDQNNADRGVVGTAGIGYRGGDFQSDNLRIFQTSSRHLASKDPDSLGFQPRYDASFGVFQGGRLARTASF